MRVASLGAIPKDDERVRVIFDATHFVQINNHIRIQDRLEFPGPEASAAVMEETLEVGYRLMVAVAADIALAHRRFKHRAEDVGLLGCRADEEGWHLWSGLCGLPLCPSGVPRALFPVIVCRRLEDVGGR